MLVLIGCNHNSAPIELRERLAFARTDLAPAIRELLAMPHVREAFILSTCNRVELLVRVEGPAARGTQAIRTLIERRDRVRAEELDRHTYEWTGSDAVRHLFRVAAGLDSMILGEPQIHGQVKQAYLDARDAGGVGTITDRLFRQCLTTVKRIRTETGISRHAVSVGFAATQLAKRIFGDLKGRSVLMLGAGKMTELVARHLIGNGVGHVIVASRTYNHAVSAAERCSGEAIHWGRYDERLAQVDIVISCTASQRPILDKRRVAEAMRARRGKPLFLIDIAVPRDIESDVNELDNVYLYDIDGLQGVVDSNLEERRHAAELASQEVLRDVQEFDRWRRELTLKPTIVALRGHVQQIGLQQWERYRTKLGPMSEEQEQLISAMIRGVVQKILHRPVTHLRGSVKRGDVESTTALCRSIFGLDDPAACDEEGTNDVPADRRGPQRLLKGGRED